MPVVNFHLIEGATTLSQDERLLKEAAQMYSDVLRSPMERVRAFITTHTATRFFVAGELVSNNNLHAPYFDFIVLEGRPVEERQKLLTGFTDLIVDILNVKRDLVRGSCRRVEPQDWAIGGVPASDLRKDEVKARELAAQAKK